MKYLFGDGTESTLSLNYLEYLRAALGFSSAVLKGETNVEARGLEAEQAKARAEEELRQLDGVGGKLGKALEDIAADVSTPASSGCVEGLKSVTQSEIERAKGSIQSNLTTELQRLSSIVAGERAANERRLEKLLLGHDLPECNCWVHADTDDEGNFQVTLEGRSELNVEYSVDLSIPENHLFSGPLRIDKIDPELVVKVPQNAGWGRKGVKIRTFKLAKEFVVALNHENGGVRIELRNAPSDGHSGYDLTFRNDNIEVTRIAKQQPGDPFTPDAEDVPKLLNLRDTAKNAIDELGKSRQVLKAVKFEDIQLRDHEEPSKLVHGLIAQMIPVVREISEHSLTRGELVLKRVLSDDRREEIFASVVDLRGILDGLSDEKRALFAPLGFDAYVDPNPKKEKLDENLLVEELDDDSLLEVSDDDIEEDKGLELKSPPRRSSSPPPFRPSSIPPPISRPSSIPRPSTPPPTPSSLPKPKKS